MITKALHVLALAVYMLTPIHSFAYSRFESCVTALHKNGGLSLRDSQEYCLQKPSDQLLSCQNNLFHVAHFSPTLALEHCEGDELLDSIFKGPVYHGQYQNIPDGNKKTVCSITVNSEEERASFQKVLSHDSHDFVELLPARETDRFVKRDTNWLNRSCEQNVRCDVLVFSGHFADSFIGDAGFEVSMADLQKFRQKDSCANFFDSIKEVYLFGCNTLAGKTPDHRSIDQYLQVLIEDGVAPHTAQRIAGRRYTPYDYSVAEKMSQIFSNATFVAGFPSVGPTGARVQKTLENYLNQYQGTESLEDKIKIFKQTLGSMGMISVNPSQHQTTKSNVLPLDKSKKLNKQELQNFAKSYGTVLPVAAVDLALAGYEQAILSEADLKNIRSNLQNTWNQMSGLEKVRRLCPLTLADHDAWIPKSLNCLEDTNWLRR